MPILPPEPDCHPEDLFDQADLRSRSWMVAYTKSRQEKQLMRKLRASNIAHYGPQIPHRFRSPNGRVRTSYVPLFSNYVFVCGGEDERYQTVCTGCVQRMDPVTEVDTFVDDLDQIRRLIQMDVPITIQSTLSPGQRVRVTSGSFAGYEGVVEDRHNETLLIVSVQFMDQGVSVKLDDCQLEKI